jgi:hypothetical protein
MQCRLKALCVCLNKNKITLQEILLDIGNKIRKRIFD